MKYFAIYHKPSGRYLPDVGRGFTHVEPVDPAYVPPRLFMTEGAAKTALTWWLKGKTTVTHRQGSWLYGEESDERWHTEPVADRRAEDMEIAHLHLFR